jgi:hypothetical protein
VSGRLDWIDISIASLNFGGVNIKDAGGSILSVDIGTEYRLFDNLAIGAAYR